MNCTNGVEGARARKSLDYRHLVKSCDFRHHMGLPPSCHSKSEALEGPLIAPPQCLSSHQDFFRLQADRNILKCLFCAGPSSILSCWSMCFLFHYDHFTGTTGGRRDK